MRICHLIYDDVDNPWLGGGGAYRARQMYKRLSERHEITLITGSYPGCHAEEHTDGIRVLRVGSPSTYALSRLTYSIKAPRVLRQLKWDVWVNEFSAYSPLRIPRRLRQKGVLFFQHFMGGLAIKKRPLAGLVALWAEHRVLGAYPHILTVSPSVQTRIRQRVAKTVPVDCVFNGVDSVYFDGKPTEESFILYLGRIDIYTKGIDILLKAFQKIAYERPNVCLKIAGGGEENQRKHLERLIRQHGLGRKVKVLGRVSDLEKRTLLASALFVCMPSRYEGWGMVAIEANASGTAVVASAIDGLRDAVQDGQTGLLVPSGDSEALAARMGTLLSDFQLRQSLGERGRKYARRFSWDQLAREKEEILITASANALSKKNM